MGPRRWRCARLQPDRGGARPYADGGWRAGSQWRRPPGVRACARDPRSNARWAPQAPEPAPCRPPERTRSRETAGAPVPRGTHFSSCGEAGRAAETIRSAAWQGARPPVSPGRGRCRRRTSARRPAGSRAPSASSSCQSESRLRHRLLGEAHSKASLVVDSCSPHCTPGAKISQPQRNRPPIDKVVWKQALAAAVISPAMPSSDEFDFPTRLNFGICFRFQDETQMRSRTSGTQ